MNNWGITNRTLLGTLRVEPALNRPDLLAEPVVKALAAHPDAGSALVAEVDPALADTRDLCAAYRVPPAAAANCVVLTGRRDGEIRYASATVLATTRVGSGVKRPMDVRRASFAPMADAVGLTGMAYGGITPVGLPGGWPVLVDRAVADAPVVVLGGGRRTGKLVVPGAFVATLPGAVVVEDLARPAEQVPLV